MVPLNRIQKSVKAMIGQNISEAESLKFIMYLHEALDDRERSDINELLKSPAMNVDETSL